MLSREDVGRVVRETWEAWAREQPDVSEHPSWLVPWELLPEREREVDMRIGDAVVNAAFPSLRARVAAAVAECERIELAPGLSTVRGQRPTSPHVIAAQRIRAKLEGR